MTTFACLLVSHVFCAKSMLQDCAVLLQLSRCTAMGTQPDSSSCLLQSQVWNIIQDNMASQDRWPKRYLDMFWSKTSLKYRTRFELTVFLVGNGLQPATLRAWYKARQLLRDAAAQRHVDSLITAMHDHRSGCHNKWYTFDLHNGRMEYLDGQPKASTR